jgi:hypothetical protein
MHPPPSPAWANFTLMIECKPESSRCYSVYSVMEPTSPQAANIPRKEGLATSTSVLPFQDRHQAEILGFLLKGHHHEIEKILQEVLKG